MDLVTEFARRGPWITQFVIDGVATGGDYQVTNDRRVQQFFERFPNVHTILELGSLEGRSHFYSRHGTQASNEFSPSKRAPQTSKKRNSLARCLAFQTYNSGRRTLSSSSCQSRIFRCHFLLRVALPLAGTMETDFASATCGTISLSMDCLCE